MAFLDRVKGYFTNTKRVDSDEYVGVIYDTYGSDSKDGRLVNFVPGEGLLVYANNCKDEKYGKDEIESVELINKSDWYEAGSAETMDLVLCVRFRNGKNGTLKVPLAAYSFAQGGAVPDDGTHVRDFKLFDRGLRPFLKYIGSDIDTDYSLFEVLVVYVEGTKIKGHVDFFVEHSESDLYGKIKAKYESNCPGFSIYKRKTAPGKKGFWLITESDEAAKQYFERYTYDSITFDQCNVFVGKMKEE